MKFIKKIHQHRNDKVAYQTMWFTLSHYSSIGVGFVLNLILAKHLGPASFGLYAFSISTLLFLSIFFEFGYIVSLSRLLALTPDRLKERELLGSFIIVLTFLAIIFFMSSYSIALFIDRFFADKIGPTLRIVSIFSIGFSLPFFVETIFKGCNQIKLLSIYKIGWKTFSLICIFTLLFTNNLSPLSALLSFALPNILISILVIAALKPKFTHLLENLKAIQEENKRYGTYNYFSRIIGTGSFQLDRLFISYFINARQVGLYSLSFSISDPITSFSRGISFSKFKKFSIQPKITSKVFKTTFALSLLSSIGSLAIGLAIVYFYLGSPYSMIYSILPILVIASLFQSLYTPLNEWLGGQGYGLTQLKASSFSALVTITGNLLLIPKFGAIGAAIVSVITNLTFLLICYKFYFEKKQT